MSAFLRHRLDVAESRSAERGAELHSVRAEKERLASFARKIIGISAFEGQDLDGGEVQSIAETLGLIVACKYDPQRHGPSDYAEPGNDFYEFAPILRAARSQRQP